MWTHIHTHTHKEVQHPHTRMCRLQPMFQEYQMLGWKAFLWKMWPFHHFFQLVPRHMTAGSRSKSTSGVTVSRRLLCSPPAAAPGSPAAGSNLVKALYQFKRDTWPLTHISLCLFSFFPIFVFVPLCLLTLSPLKAQHRTVFSLLLKVAENTYCRSRCLLC